MINSCVVNTIYYLELFVTNSNGNPQSGLITSYTIYKASDDSIITSGSLTDVGNGIYKASYTFTILGQYYIIYSAPSGYTDEVELIWVIQDYAKADDLLRVLGLSEENKKIYNTVYDANGNLTFANIKTYPTATDFVNDTNILATYEFTATYDTNDLMLTMGVKRL